ncbi:MAG: agmatine deiminase family protein [Candidatus Hydrogenedentes bacterium]|nr:agmatine deiminase family protein [Candidatus Hydrogenedentota bacterium]
MTPHGITRFPAEWEPQSAVQLTWPHEDTDWKQSLADVESCFDVITAAISRYEPILIACADPAYVVDRVTRAGADPDRIRAYRVATNDTWARDHGPITVLRDGQPVLLDFAFNGWGGKFPAEHDDAITLSLFSQKAFGEIGMETLPVVLEGGSIETDGEGTILTTTSCLLNPNRNGSTTEAEAEFVLRENLGAHRVLWLHHGNLIGDDTDGHIDTLARFCDPTTIAYVTCTDKRDKHYHSLKEMEEELRELRMADGEPYRLVPLPWPRACYDPEKKRLPATYANFLIINGAVLVPTYGDKADAKALAAVGSCFPDREIVGIDCRAVIAQGGSLHCLTMQIPAGVQI